MIHFNDFAAAPAPHIEQEIAAAAKVIHSGWYVLGPEVTAFERAWAAYCGTEHAVGVANGMDALEIGLRVLNIGAGDEVITTPMTAFATVLSIMRTGATPVFADIDPQTALLSPQSVRRCLSNRTRAVIPVHLYGRIADMDSWLALQNETGVAVVEDCAQAHGAAWRGRFAGAWGTVGAYSFYPTKNLGAIGDGGALICNNPHMADMARKLRNYGQSERYTHPHIGLNSRLDELQAAILLKKLEHLPEFTARRRAIATMFLRNLINPKVRPLANPQNKENHVYHLFVVNCNERDRLQQHMRDANVETLIHYPIPAHHQPPCALLPRDPYGLGNSEVHGATCLSLPCHPFLTDTDVATIIDAVNTFH